HVRQSRRARSSAQRRTTEVSYRPMARNRRNDSAARDHTQRITQSGEDYESKMRSPNLRNAALILSLSGSASLRETSAIQGREQAFAPRRQGAKKAWQSKSPVPSLDLSGFASLRETSPIQGREEVLAPRRKAAMKKDTSNGRISISNLSGLAPLRDTSSKHQRFFRHAIGDALDSMLDHVLAEIDKEGESLVHEAQIGQNLLAVDRIERSDRFHFHDHKIIDDQIGAETFVEPDPIPYDRNRYLSF